MRSIMINKFLLTIMLSMVSIVFVPAPPAAIACSCVEPQSVEVELMRSEAVFLGTALEVKEHKGLGGYVKGKSILFEVEESWKGAEESQIIIKTGQGGGDCGYNFQKGVEYLVYANSSSMYGNEDELVSIICSRTAELSKAQEDLSVFGEGDVTQKQVNLKGELDGVNLYVWILVVILLGTLGFMIVIGRRRIVKKQKQKQK